MAITPRWDVALLFRGPEAKVHYVVLNYTGNNPNTQINTQLVADAVSLAWSGVAKPVITTECTFVGSRVRYISPAAGWDAESTSGTGPGTVTGDTCPAEISALFEKRGTGPVKNARGTAYWPCVPVAYVNSSLLNATGTAAYAPVATQFVANIIGGPITIVPAVMSRKTDTLYNVTSSTIKGYLGSQRRRRPEPL